MKDLEKKAKAYALKNAISYDGKSQMGSIIPALFNEGLKKTDMKKYSKKISKIIDEVNSLSLEEQKKQFEKFEKEISKRDIREGLKELSIVKGKVVMRFAPSASGPLHIGHALILGLNILYVKKYKGKLFIRIEDTNPENIDPESYKLIEKDSKWLFKDSKIIIQSDRIEIYYKYAEKLIKKNSAYVCVCSGDKFREFSKQKKNCPCRKLSSKENLERWKKMLSSNSKENFKVGEAVLRFKSSMKDPNPAMRDFPLARINTNKHPRTKNKFRVWPLMNLAVSVDDIELGMTHILRGKDHRDNSKRQELIYSALGKKYPEVSFIGIVHFKGMELSTTKMREGIESGKFKGWDDKDLPTLISLKKQKYKSEAFLKFSESVGLGENDKTIDKKEYFTLLNSYNK